MARRGGPNRPPRKPPAPPKRNPPRRVPPPINPLAGLPGPAGGGFNPYLGYGTGFNYYGHHFSAADQNAFERALRQHGINPARWYANHPGAGKVFDPVAQGIYGNVAPQLTGINQQRKDAQDYYNKMMSSLTNFASALMPYLQQVPQVIAGAYEQGAKADTLLGQAYGGQFDKSQNENIGGIRDTLQQLGLQGGPAASNDASVVSTLGGGLEADILKAAGPAYANAAAQWPKQASLEAQSVMNDLLKQAVGANKDFDSQVQQVLQGIPGMQAQYQSQIASQKLAEKKYQLEVIKQNEEAAYRNWYIAKTEHKDKEAEYWKRQQQELEKQRIALSQGNLDLSRRRQRAKEQAALGLNPSGTKPLPGFRWKNPNDHSQGTVKIPTAKGGKGGSLREGETPAAIRSKASHDLQTWINSHTEDGLVPGKKVKNFTYKQAFQYLYHAYVGYVKTSFKSEAAYRKMIKDLLAANGITPGGK